MTFYLTPCLGSSEPVGGRHLRGGVQGRGRGAELEADSFSEAKAFHYRPFYEPSLKILYYVGVFYQPNNARDHAFQPG